MRDVPRFWGVYRFHKTRVKREPQPKLWGGKANGKSPRKHKKKRPRIISLNLPRGAEREKRTLKSSFRLPKFPLRV